MAVYQDCVAEPLPGPFERLSEQPVLRHIDVPDAGKGIVDGHPARVDRLTVGDDARDRAKTAGDTGRAGVGEGRQPAVEHPRVELIGFAIDVEPGAREMRAKQRRTMSEGCTEQSIDVDILGLADGVLVEPRGREEVRIVARTAMRGIEHEWGKLLGGLDQFEGVRLAIAGRCTHSPDSIPYACAATGAFAKLAKNLRSCPLDADPATVHAIFTSPRIIGRTLGVRRDGGGNEVVLMSRILLAEDDDDMRRFLAKALEAAGHDVVSFDNGLSAYERLREEPFTLLLTDIVMPEMDGIELARKATELDPDLKVMFITGFAAVALNPDSQAPKDAKVLSKPFHLRDLVNEVEKLLAA